MSIVAYRNGVIASDNQATYGSTKYPVKKLQVIQLSFGLRAVVGITGDMAHRAPLLKWYRSGGDPKDFPEFQKTDNWTRLIIATPSGFLTVIEREPQPLKFNNPPYMAYGMGRDFAMGAMFMGGTAVEAVHAANQHSEGCGFGVTSFDLSKLDEYPIDDPEVF